MHFFVTVSWTLKSKIGYVSLQVLYSSKSIALCAPTGSGKTVVFELAIIRLLMQRDTQHVQDFKVVYSTYVICHVSEKITIYGVVMWHRAQVQ